MVLKVFSDFSICKNLKIIFGTAISIIGTIILASGITSLFFYFSNFNLHENLSLLLNYDDLPIIVNQYCVETTESVKKFALNLSIVILYGASILTGIIISLTLNIENYILLKRSLYYLINFLYKILRYIMYIIPLAVGYGIIYMIKTIPPNIFFELLKQFYPYFYISGIYIFVLTICIFLSSNNNKNSIKKYIEMLLTAFFTSSSNATLPYNLNYTHSIHMKSSINDSFLLLSTNINKTGSIIYLLCVYFSFFHFSFSYNTICNILAIILLSFGCSGIPMGGYIATIILFNMFGIPGYHLIFFFIFEKLFDMITTTMNNVGSIFSMITLNNFLNHKFFNKLLKEE